MRWHDHETKTVFIFPPAGEKVQFKSGGSWVNGEVVGMSASGGCVIEHSEGFQLVCWEGDIRPIDWDKLSSLESLIESIIMQRFSSVGDAAKSIVDAILAAGYRKCDNKTPPTKE